MSIHVQCEKCGRGLVAPREAAGKQGKCPQCQSDVYIPTPEEEIEELPLAPEDEREREREARLLAERRQVDHMLAHETAGPDDAAPRSPARTGGPAPGTGRTTVKGVVLAYLAAMRDSDLARAEQALTLLADHRDETLKVIERLAADQIPPPEMAGVPVAVYQGFLKGLHAKM
ncbi:MAG: hypothetical protein KA354_21750 [Phycisphaerae bacterium]|nr:hypothetical protein [Phycisphaerae bacterium]